MDAPTFGSDLRNRLARTAAMTYPTGIVGPRCCASLSLQANPTPRMESSVDDRLLPSVYLLSSTAANRTISGDGLSIEPDFRPGAQRFQSRPAPHFYEKNACRPQGDRKPGLSFAAHRSRSEW